MNYTLYVKWYRHAVYMAGRYEHKYRTAKYVIDSGESHYYWQYWKKTVNLFYNKLKEAENVQSKSTY